MVVFGSGSVFRLSQVRAGPAEAKIALGGMGGGPGGGPPRCGGCADVANARAKSRIVRFIAGHPANDYIEFADGPWGGPLCVRDTAPRVPSTCSKLTECVYIAAELG